MIAKCAYIMVEILMKNNSVNILKNLKIQEIFDLRPNAIINKFSLKNPIFQVTASYGHMGRDHFTRMEIFYPNINGDETIEKEVEFFTWEKLDYVDTLKEAFGL